MDIFDFLKVSGFLSQNEHDETSLVGNHTLRLRNRAIREAAEEYRRLMVLAHSGMIEPNPLEKLAIHLLASHAEHITGKGIMKLMQQQQANKSPPKVHKPEKIGVD